MAGGCSILPQVALDLLPPVSQQSASEWRSWLRPQPPPPPPTENSPGSCFSLSPPHSQGCYVRTSSLAPGTAVRMHPTPCKDFSWSPSCPPQPLFPQLYRPAVSHPQFKEAGAISREGRVGGFVFWETDQAAQSLPTTH